MKVLWALVTSGILWGAATGAHAGSASPLEGVWTSDAGACPLMAEVGTRAIFLADEDFAIVTLDQGLIGFEFFCDFDDVVLGKDGKSAVIASTCGAPGESFEDVIYLDWFEDKSTDNTARFEFNSLFITGQERPGNGDAQARFLFTRCDQLTEQMLVERSEP